jgi:hypothetical protein
MEPMIAVLVPLRIAGAMRVSVAAAAGTCRNQLQPLRLSSHLRARLHRTLTASGAIHDRLSERAALCGIETEFWDAFGQHRTVEPEVLARLSVGRRWPSSRAAAAANYRRARRL